MQKKEVTVTRSNEIKIDSFKLLAEFSYCSFQPKNTNFNNTKALNVLKFKIDCNKLRICIKYEFINFYKLLTCFDSH